MTGRTLRRMLGLGLLSSVLTVTAMQASAQGVINVRGSRTCQYYLDAKAQGSERDVLANWEWLLGYMSGLAVATGVDILREANGGEAMVNWLDAYCKLYPAKYVSDAGDLYYKYLQEKMKGSTDAEKTQVRKEVK